MKNSLVFLIICISAISYGLWLHIQAGYNLPMPVGDEVAFYYPAHNLAEKGTMLSPQINPDRVLFWMPPGYVIFLSGWLKIAGTGMASARWLSFILSSVAFLLWSIWLYRFYRPRPVQAPGFKLPGRGINAQGFSIGFLAFAFLSVHWVVMGNFIRMEALLLCMAGAGLLLQQGRQVWASLAVLALALSVHPNAIYFLFWWAIVNVIGWRQAKQSIKNLRRQLWVIGPCLLLLGIFTLYWLNNWPQVLADWKFQLGTREAGGLALLAFRPDQAVFLVGIAAAIFVVWRKGQLPAHAPLLFLCLVLWLLRVLGQGWSYGIFSVLSATLLAGWWVVFLAQGWAWFGFLQKSDFLRHAIPASLAMACLLVARVFSWPIPAAQQWMGMQPEGIFTTPYFTQDDRLVLKQKLRALGYQHQQRFGRSARVYFLPEGDGIIINGPEPLPTQPWMHTLPIFTDSAPDYILWHRTARGVFFNYATEDMSQICQPDTLPTWHWRAGHQWLLLNVKGKRPAWMRN